MSDKKLYVYVNSKGVCPSGYYRILQFFNEEEMNVHSLMSPQIYSSWHRSSDLCRKILSPLLFLYIAIRVFSFLAHDLFVLKNGYLVISRTISPHYLPLLSSYILKRIARTNTIIWDFDDNILSSGTISRKEFNLLSQISSHIIVTGEHLKEIVAEEYHEKVLLLPTTDGTMDELSFSEAINERKKTYKDNFKLVWIATAGNRFHLNKIIRVLDECAVEMCKNNVKLTLTIVSSLPYIHLVKALEIRNVRWSREEAISQMLKSHVGIMPLIDSEFSRGKGGFKLIQYMAAYLPVIASNVGINKQIVDSSIGFLCDDNDNQNIWKESILKIYKDYPLYENMSRNARERYEEFFSCESNAKQWRKIVEL